MRTQQESESSPLQITMPRLLRLWLPIRLPGDQLPRRNPTSISAITASHKMTASFPAASELFTLALASQGEKNGYQSSGNSLLANKSREHAGLVLELRLYQLLLDNPKQIHSYIVQLFPSLKTGRMFVSRRYPLFFPENIASHYDCSSPHPTTSFISDLS